VYAKIREAVITGNTEIGDIAFFTQAGSLGVIVMWARVEVMCVDRQIPSSRITAL